VTPHGAPVSDYAQLKGRVRDADLLERQSAFYVRSIAAKLTVLAGCLVVFLVVRQAWALALDAVALAIMWGNWASNCTTLVTDRCSGRRDSTWPSAS
jgi:hypothetical protein